MNKSNLDRPSFESNDNRKYSRQKISRKYTGRIGVLTVTLTFFLIKN